MIAKKSSSTVVCLLHVFLLYLASSNWSTNVEAAIYSTPTRVERIIALHNEKPIQQLQAVASKSALVDIRFPESKLEHLGKSRNEILAHSTCRGGGSRFKIQLAEIVSEDSEPKFKDFRNFKQTDDGIMIGTLKPGRTYLLRAQCVFKYNAKPHDGLWSDPIEFTTLE